MTSPNLLAFMEKPEPAASSSTRAWAASETAVVKGPKGGVTAKNSSNCVYIHADSATEVVRLSPPAPGGIKIKLAD